MGLVAYSVAGILGFSRDAEAERDRSVASDRETVEVRALLDRAQAGDQAAFGRLVDLHQRVVFRTALAALGRREDAEDAAQEAFIQAWRNLPGFRGDAAFRTWLLTIVWRKALDRRKSRLAWWKRTVVAVDDRDPVADVVELAADPERETVARDTARRVHEEISRLSPTLRDTLLLAASGEYTYDEIAAMLNTPLGTIKWRVSEARRIVASRMDA